MKVTAQILIVLGFCVGTLGAAGFGKELEPAALPLFVIGLAVLGIGGYLARAARTKGGAEVTLHEELARYRDLLVAIRDEVRAIETASSQVSARETRDRIEALRAGDLFDLTAEHEDLASILGFQGYARVWEGVATGERLLNRAWSMLTDGAHEEGLAEIPIARAQLDGSVVAMESVS